MVTKNVIRPDKVSDWPECTLKIQVGCQIFLSYVSHFLMFSPHTIGVRAELEYIYCCLLAQSRIIKVVPHDLGMWHFNAVSKMHFTSWVWHINQCQSTYNITETGSTPKIPSFVRDTRIYHQRCPSTWRHIFSRFARGQSPSLNI